MIESQVEPASGAATLYRTPSAQTNGPGAGAPAPVDASLLALRQRQFVLWRPAVDELGINALELLPPADSAYVRTWGYGTTNFLAPDFELGFPADSSHPTPNRDLCTLVAALHQHGVRFFVDSVTAFAKGNPYLAAATEISSSSTPSPTTRTGTAPAPRSATGSEAVCSGTRPSQTAMTR